MLGQMYGRELAPCIPSTSPPKKSSTSWRLFNGSCAIQSLSLFMARDDRRRLGNYAPRNGFVTSHAFFHGTLNLSGSHIALFTSTIPETR